MTANDAIAPTCRDCVLREVCRDRELACAVFERWTNTGKTSSAKRTATRATYERVFLEDVA